jgi:hypothetical protein
MGTPQSELNNSITPIEKLIQEGLAQRFYQVFGIHLVYSNAPNKKEMAAKLVQRGVAYPFAFAAVSSEGIRETSYKPHTLLRRGLIYGASHDRMLTYRLNMIPVNTKFDITFEAEAFSDAMAFSKTWLMACLQGALKFSITYGVADVDVHVDMDREIAIPSRDGGVTEIEEYTLSTGLLLEGYFSKDYLGKAQAVVDVEVEGIATPLGSHAPADSEEALLQGKDPSSVQVFLFNRPWTTVPGPAADPIDVEGV